MLVSAAEQSAGPHTRGAKLVTYPQLSPPRRLPMGLLPVHRQLLLPQRHQPFPCHPNVFMCSQLPQRAPQPAAPVPPRAIYLHHFPLGTGRVSRGDWVVSAFARLRVMRNLACPPTKLRREGSDICSKLDRCRRRHPVCGRGVWRIFWATSDGSEMFGFFPFSSHCLPFSLGHELIALNRSRDKLSIKLSVARRFCVFRTKSLQITVKHGRIPSFRILVFDSSSNYHVP